MDVDTNALTNYPSFLKPVFEKILFLIERLRIEGHIEVIKFINYIFENKTVFYIVLAVLVFFLVRFLWHKFA